jgi:hypothetical protein
MNNAAHPLPGYAIGAIATASGADFLDAAIGVAAVLGGIAGPSAGLEGPAGDLIHPGVNLAVAGQNSPSWCRLEELLLEPLIACQRMFRDLSRAASPARLDHLQFSYTAGGTNDIAERSKAGLFANPGASAQCVDPNRHIDALRRPSFFLRSPDSNTLRAALPEVMDAAAFLHYGEELFTHLLDKRPGKEWSQLAAALSGSDQPFERDKRVGPGRIDIVKACLLVTSTRECLRDALAFDGAAIQRILQGSVLLDPGRCAPTAKMEPQNIRWGYQTYYNTIKEVLDARRAGTGFQLAVKPETAALHEFTGELQDWCHGVIASAPAVLLRRPEPAVPAALGVPGHFGSEGSR